MNIDEYSDVVKAEFVDVPKNINTEVDKIIVEHGQMNENVNLNEEGKEQSIYSSI